MSLIEKTGLWVVASVAAISSVFAQTSNKCPCPAPEPKCPPCNVPVAPTMAAYNAPARVDVCGSWDVFASASFTYWQPVQDNMELGVVNDTAVSGTGFNGNVINSNFDYKPGFKVGLGMNFDLDNWDTFLEYTWFRGAHNTSSSQAAGGTSTIYSLWGAPSGVGGDDFYAASQRWKLHMDFLDWQLGRHYFVGTKLTFRPFFAARAAWIRQNLSATYSDASAAATTPGSSYDVSKKSHSWAIGPRAGLCTNWMVGEGFRLYGNGAGDILFTQYTRLSSSEVAVSAAGVAGDTFAVHQRKLNTLRTHLELELGLGWGSYFDNNNWHVDLSAGYGFQAFFDQNMFRHFTDDTNTVTSNVPNGNLYVHGLTATARFDF